LASSSTNSLVVNTSIVVVSILIASGYLQEVDPRTLLG